MFQNLVEYGYERSGLEALGFYVAYLLVILLAGSVAGGLFAILSPSGDRFSAGVRAGALVAAVSVPVIAVAVIRAKNLASHFGLWLVVLLAAILALLGGAIAGLIPVAYLTTWKIEAEDTGRPPPIG